MHLVIDLYCKSFPSVNLEQESHELYRVRKGDDLGVSQTSLGPLASIKTKS